MFDLSVITREVANIIEDQVRQSFTQQKDLTTNRSWSPLKPKTLRYKPRNKPILERSGLMRSAVRVDIEGNSITARVNVPYAPFHQHGTRKMPQRRFMPFDDQGRPSPTLENEIKQILEPTGKGGQDLLRQVGLFLFS
ncbi:phage virion morphogenesis protein [Helicobacter suis]|uniref:phage virion morphogenesis protein n=1 Tax=Helicobacter suis TaxID=104628 RepID=UPI0013D463B6|nr:phage virion morphogenesis protein [Helicobacter suis]